MWSRGLVGQFVEVASKQNSTVQRVGSNELEKYSFRWDPGTSSPICLMLLPTFPNYSLSQGLTSEGEVIHLCAVLGHALGHLGSC